MVSGFFTSPCDQARMSSAEARPIRSSSKTLTSSKGGPTSFACRQNRLNGNVAKGAGPPPTLHGRAAGSTSDLFDAAGVRAPGQVDAELLRCAVDLVVVLLHVDGDAVRGEHLHVQAERLHLLEEHLEGLRDARVGDVLPLDDRLVHLDASGDVVRLDGEELLQRVGSAVRLQGPDLHLAEPLATELRLTTQRLLRDHRVRTRGACVDLVVDKVVQLEDVHVADRDRLRERLAGAPVEQARLAVTTHGALAVTVRQRGREQTGEGRLRDTVEHGRRDRVAGRRRRGDGRDVVPPRDVTLGELDVPALLGHPAEVRLEDLADVHAAGHTERVEDDVDRGPVREERHVLDGQDLGDDALVAVTAGELVAVRDLAALRDVHADQLVDAGGQLVAVLPAERADLDDRAGLAVGHLERRVADLARLLTEDRAEQALLRGELGLALGRDLADEDVARADLGTDADDAALVEVREDVLGDVRDVPRDLLGAELGVARVDLVLLDVDRGEHVVLHETLAEDDRVLVVVTLPGHERDQQVAAE